MCDGTMGYCHDVVASDLDAADRRRDGRRQGGSRQGHGNNPPSPKLRRDTKWDGNGDGQGPASYQGDPRKLYQGRALVVVRTSKQTGSITLTARTAGIAEAVTTIQAKAVDLGPPLP